MKTEMAVTDPRVYAFVFAVALLLAWPLAALSHAHPEQRSPAPNASLQQAPEAVRIVFTEDLEGAFSTLKVVAENGQSVTDGASAVAADNPRLMQVALQPLAAGTYTVKWHAVARDGHTTAGEYTFQVEPQQ